MMAFDIHDIRYLWSTDEKFVNQFKNKNFDQIKFKPYSNLPNISKNISFWINEDNLDNKNNWSNENDFFELAHDTFDDWIEEICGFDIFIHPKTKKCSRMLTGANFSRAKLFSSKKLWVKNILLLKFFKFAPPSV